ncbi:hypothetical protein BC936DRAFT_143385 [Jimgerdemannia flammicorona]|uniref:Cryptic loci regulator 2 N-terminal domain-containing protein n=1 Tax=Jimgerdemannia flammicorona TaxID=994334 RepID=A0A432ZZ16_9FUNG|nr:hypothetical protein BC936DRAFT_143385 [Jimgerdemannia flammicorona]
MEGISPSIFSDGTSEYYPNESNESEIEDNDGLINYYRPYPKEDISYKNCMEKLGESLADERGLPSTRKYVLTKFPKGYKLFEKVKEHMPYRERKPAKLNVVVIKNGKPTDSRSDFYLFGHPYGSYFRSIVSFVPHLRWLESNKKHDYTECQCRICEKYVKNNEQPAKNKRPKITKNGGSARGESSSVIVIRKTKEARRDKEGESSKSKDKEDKSSKTKETKESEPSGTKRVRRNEQDERNKESEAPKMKKARHSEQDERNKESEAPKMKKARHNEQDERNKESEAPKMKKARHNEQGERDHESEPSGMNEARHNKRAMPFRMEEIRRNKRDEGSKRMMRAERAEREVREVKSNTERINGFK